MSIQDTEVVTANFNKKAMDYLECNNFNSALSLLHQANFLLKNKQLTDGIIKLKCTTLNNLGCVYKRLEKHKKALQYLHEALTLGTRFNSITDMAGVHLNISVIKSLLSSHEEALFHALKALKIANKHIVRDSVKTNTLLSAYFQCAHEFQQLHKAKDAIRYLQHGYEISSIQLGKNHIITLKFFKALHDKSMKNIRPGGDLKKINNILQPIKEKRNGTAVRRDEVKSTEPRYNVRTHRQTRSYIPSPAQIKKLNKSPQSSGNYVKKSPEIKKNMENIEKSLHGIQNFLDSYKAKVPLFNKFSRASLSLSITPKSNYSKVENAVIIIQKNVRMWISKKKYNQILKNVKIIQNFYRDRKIRRKIKEGVGVNEFNGQFNYDVLIKETKKKIEKSVQTYLEVKRGISFSIMPTKKVKFHNEIIKLQRFIRRFLARKKYLLQKVQE
ncbi:hypothetical protein SteCoe_2467 [Stentor coeruleus]|uniref:Uncharacterized protein n=1 Tax=Stentor coeruleus TaxID=5963 RepID=A0A1R2CZI5_9CILI|nr:hypothetical protein SteCoe_2467 [Stentor coeruleus]